MTPSLTVRWLFVLGRLEGASFLVLLGIAMPLKYMLGMSKATLWIGWIHGLLFLAFLAALVSARRTERWPAKWLLLGFAAALLPFGTFVFERAVKKQLGPR